MSTAIKVYSREHRRLITVTLLKGKHFREQSERRDEEGYSSRDVIISHKGSHLEMEVKSEASDCDGRVSSYTEYTWPIGGELQQSGVPKWKKIDSSQRDYAAERAGY